MPTFQARTSFWLAGAVVAMALWTSASPTLVYPIYQTEWGVSTTTVTWIFGIYSLALIPVLILLGDISDYIGRRNAMILGLLAELIGVLFFVIANDVVWLLIGRAFMGAGVGLSLSPASVAMVEFSKPGQEQRASAVATGISALGTALAMIVGGLLTQYAPFPKRLTFVVIVVVIAALVPLLLGIPKHTHDEARQKWRIRPIVIPRGSRGIFLAGATAATSAFLVSALVLPLGARIANQLAGSTNALVTGSLLTIFAVCIMVSALFARRLGEWTVVTLGAVGAIAAVWLYVATGEAHSLLLFLVGSAVAGEAYAFSWAGGLTVLNRYAAAQHRASMVSGGYLVGYAVQGSGAPFLGWVVTSRGLMDGLLTGAVVFSAFFMMVLVICLVARHATRVSRHVC